jgi:hypothetical protein
VPEDARLQAIAWVRQSDGVVLRQDVLISTSRLRFDRLPEEEAIKQGNKLLNDSRYHRRGRGRGGRGRWERRPDGPPWHASGEWRQRTGPRPAELPADNANGQL